MTSIPIQIEGGSMVEQERKRLVDVIGARLFRKVQEEFAGQVIYIPKPGNPRLRRDTLVAVHRQHIENGMTFQASAEALAVMFKIRIQIVYRILERYGCEQAS